jgi:hypothetical protein
MQIRSAYFDGSRFGVQCLISNVDVMSGPTLEEVRRRARALGVSREAVDATILAARATERKAAGALGDDDEPKATPAKKKKSRGTTKEKTVKKSKKQKASHCAPRFNAARFERDVDELLQGAAEDVAAFAASVQAQAHPEAFGMHHAPGVIDGHSRDFVAQSFGFPNAAAMHDAHSALSFQTHQAGKVSTAEPAPRDPRTLDPTRRMAFEAKGRK